MSALGSIRLAEFTRSGSNLTGHAPVADMPRLQDLLARNEGELRYAVKGAVTERGHQTLGLQVSGTLWVKCQRCLEAVAINIATDRRIVYVNDPNALEAEYDADDTDVVDSVEEVDVSELLEEEVMLSLPLSPRHEDDGCKPADAVTGKAPASPFAVLASLKRDAGK